MILTLLIPKETEAKMKLGENEHNKITGDNQGVTVGDLQSNCRPRFGQNSPEKIRTKQAQKIRQRQQKLGKSNPSSLLTRVFPYADDNAGDDDVETWNIVNTHV